MNYFNEAVEAMAALYGKDVVMPLATVNNGKANVRNINAYYRDKCFYVTTYALSEKMKDIESNPSVALCHNVFVAHGQGKNIGNPLEESNRSLRDELRQVFCAFYDRHVNEADKNTCILKITLTDAVVFTNNYKYRVDFKTMQAGREDFIVDIVF